MEKKELDKAIDLATTIYSTANTLVLLASAAKPLYELVLRSMDAVEAVKDETSSKTGAQKKAWVLDFVKGKAVEFKLDWAVYEASIIKFIDAAKQLYNQYLAAKAIFAK